MILHTQKILACPIRLDGYSAEGIAGDCFRACLATILRIPKSYPIDDIPNFANSSTWWRDAREWTKNHTEGAYDLAYINPPTWPTYEGNKHSPWQSYVIVAGKSPRGDWHHAVVADCRDGRLLWDPHPSRDFIDGDILDVIALTRPY